MRPDRYLRMGLAMRRAGLTATVGFAAAAQRCPDRPGLIDEHGSLTWQQLDDRCDALGVALQQTDSGSDLPPTVAVMCRNHRGFIEALVGANRIGADVLLLNTSFAGPAMAEVIERESAGRPITVIYDEEFTDTVERALHDVPNATRILAWTDPTPAPPLVVGWAHAHLAGVINEAVSGAVASLGPDVRRPLDLYGYRIRPGADYEVIAERLAAAEAAGYPTVA